MRFHKTSRPLSLIESSGTARSPGARSAPPTLDKHLLDYVRVLVKRRWTAVTALAVVLAAASLYLYTAVPLYEATAQILIEHENANTFSLKDSVEQDRDTTDYYHTQYTILQSRSLAKRAIDALDAWNQPELTDRASAGQATGIVEGLTGGLAKMFADLRGKKAPKTQPPAKGPAGMPVSTETPAQLAVIDAFISRLTISPVLTSRLVDLKFRATDPKFAANAANALAHAYIDQDLEVRLTASKETSDWLTQQLGEQKHRIDASEAALQRYRESHNAVSLADQQKSIDQKMTDFTAMVTRAKADRIARESLYNQVRAIEARQAPLDTLPQVLSNSYLQQLKADVGRLQAQYTQLSVTLGDINPQMVALKASIDDGQAKLQRELAKQVDSMKNDLDAARSLETSLMNALTAQEQEATKLNRTGVDYGVLERDVTTNRQIFETLLARTRETSIAGELKASDVRVIDAAQPPQVPIWPRRTDTLFQAVVFGTLLGIGLAFFVEYMDDRLKTPEEVKSYLGLPFLGIVPISANKERDDRMFAEAFRQLRTNVIFTAEQRAHSLVITSTGPSEGKTVVSSNLAKGLAMTGRKVVIIDVDMRRPRVHEVFGIGRGPGLSELLAGTIDLTQAIHEMPVPDLFVMPAGGPTPTPTELLSSPQFARLLQTLVEKFGWVILDAPPVNVVADACIVANRAAAVLFVASAQQTKRSAALNALEQLDLAGATFLGAVLNKVPLRRDSFYYSSYYRPAYEKYYSKSESSPLSQNPLSINQASREPSSKNASSKTPKDPSSTEPKNEDGNAVVNG
jgi:succinoglycan biosynthesis transport protein ExoP